MMVARWKFRVMRLWARHSGLLQNEVPPKFRSQIWILKQLRNGMQTMASVSHCHGSLSGHLACSMIVRDANPNRNYLPLPRDAGGFRESSVGSDELVSS